MPELETKTPLSIIIAVPDATFTQSEIISVDKSTGFVEVQRKVPVQTTITKCNIQSARTQKEAHLKYKETLLRAIERNDVEIDLDNAVIAALS